MKSRMECKKIIFFVSLCLVLICLGCAHHIKPPEEKIYAVYSAAGEEDFLLVKHAPLFLVHDFKSVYNRIGKPKTKLGEDGNIEIYVDHSEPVLYTMKKKFAASRGEYVNLIYRVHFPEVPFSLIPFNLTAGDNVGLIVVITLDNRRNPVLVTTVHTCGCYLAIIPTSYLPHDAFPIGWKERTMQVYGEELPPVLDFKNRKNPRLLVYLRPEVHRVMSLDVVESRYMENSKKHKILYAPIETMDALEKLKANGDTVSFFYKKGLLQGHVKGSVKPWETLLLSLVSMDLFVGADKAYEDPNVTENPFYTSLKPWNRHKSNMWYFPRFLEFWGWRL